MKGTEAIDHVRDEMAQSKSGHIRMLGELMTVWLRLHPDAEIEEKKTLEGAYAALKDTAKQKQQGGCYAMADDEAFAGMMAYYGMENDVGDFRACMAAMYGARQDADAWKPEAKPKAAAMELDIDAMLEG